MNKPEPLAHLLAIPDVQSGSDDRRLAIDQVGIK
jgi:GTP cyclohydrolase FolE2